MALRIQSVENKDIATMTIKKTLKNTPMVLATSIPVIGEVVTLINDTRDSVQLEKRLQAHEKELEGLETYKSKIEKFQLEFSNLKKNMVTANEEYNIEAVKGIEIFFADYVETNDYEFIENLKECLERINDATITQGEYRCRYQEYILYEERLQILFDDIYNKEFVEDYIEAIRISITDAWHETSAIRKIMYY